MIRERSLIRRVLSAILTAGILFCLPANGWSAQKYFKVIKVYDGDTFKIDSGEHVRLIGIDSPEKNDNAKLLRDSRKTGQDTQTIKAMGQRAYEFTKRLIEGKNVRLDFDVRPRDQYDRLLAYAYLADGTFVNAEIIKNGFANVLTIPPDVRHAKLFKRLYAEARRDKKGLWVQPKVIVGR